MQKIVVILFCFFNVAESYANEGTSSSTALALARYACTECDYVTIRKLHMEMHMRIHTKERPHLCSECPAAFRRPEDCGRHMRSVHNKEKRFLCSKCPYAAARKDFLDVHELVCHPKERSIADAVEIPDPELVPNKKIKLTPEDFLNLEEYPD